jgi:hypothetical protein
MTWICFLMLAPTGSPALIASPEPLRSIYALPNEELKLTALASEAAGSPRSPAALLMVRRSLTPAR